jgi:hypothetical protein
MLLDGAAEGTAWGAALMAKFRAEALAGKATPWPAFLQRHATGKPTRFTPRPHAAAALDEAFARHKRLVAIHGQLDSAIHGDRPRHPPAPAGGFQST